MLDEAINHTHSAVHNSSETTNGTVSYSCKSNGTIGRHKLKFCDGNKDCDDGSDERSNLSLCINMTEEMKCIRNTGVIPIKNLSIPFAWISDGEKDCQNGLDEDELRIEIEACRVGGLDNALLRLGKSCREELKCKIGDGLVKLSDICSDNITCTGQRHICNFSRTFPQPVEGVMTFENGTKSISYCSSLEQEFLRAADGEQCKTALFKPQGSENLTEIEIVVPDTHLVDCEQYYGEAYLYLSCLDKCLVPAQCPLTENNTCADKFRCEANSSHCVPYSRICDLKDDCEDGSDERNCSNNFRCTSGSVSYVPISAKCDGKVDCLDFSDECNEDCSPRERFILGDSVLKITAFVIGCLSILLNGVNIYRVRKELDRTKWFRSALTKELIILIAVGDLIMGCYLATITFVEISNGDNYCKTKYLWMSSKFCALLGVMSSCGSEMSIFAMTALAIFRVLTVKSNRVAKENIFSDLAKTKLRLSAYFILGTSVTVAVLPLFSQFEDFFVTSLYYHENPIFIGKITKERHMKLFESYLKIKKGADLSWKEIRRLVRTMFTERYGGVVGSSIHYYGSDGVCVSKYLVTPEDPQSAFTLSLLLINFICFLIMCICYISINLHTKRRKVEKSMLSPTPNRIEKKRKRNLRVKTGAIIGTDFVTWIPIIIICLLHYARLIDAKPFYPFFSVVILPINSLINPLLYDSKIMDSVVEYFTLVFENLKHCIKMEKKTGYKEESVTFNTVSSAEILDTPA